MNLDVPCKEGVDGSNVNSLVRKYIHCKLSIVYINILVLLELCHFTKASKENHENVRSNILMVLQVVEK